MHFHNFIFEFFIFPVRRIVYTHTFSAVRTKQFKTTKKERNTCGFDYVRVRTAHTANLISQQNCWEDHKPISQKQAWAQTSFYECQREEEKKNHRKISFFFCFYFFFTKDHSSTLSHQKREDEYNNREYKNNKIDVNKKK